MSELRISRWAVLMDIANIISERSTCERAKVGCVISWNGRIVSTGYGGAPSGRPHCTEVGCEMENGHCRRTSHAEAGAIAWAARNGLALEGTEMHVTHKPCYECAKLIINAGIEMVVWGEDYGDDRGIELLKECGVNVVEYGVGEWT